MGRMNIALWVVDGLITVLFIFINGRISENWIRFEVSFRHGNSQINPTINKSSSCVSIDGKFTLDTSRAALTFVSAPNFSFFFLYSHGWRLDRRNSLHLPSKLEGFVEKREEMEIDLGKNAFDIDFHPSRDLITAGLIDGNLHLYRYSANVKPQRLLKVRAHTESCRAVRFINDGQAIVTCSPDKSILSTDVETGSAIACLEDAHSAAINRLINLSEATIATGDDEGCIKIWDTRQRTCCNTFAAHQEYISDMCYASDSMKLLGTSGDGTLSVCNLRRNKVQAQSEFSEDELLSVVLMKNGQKVVCGSQTGTLLLYSWGCFKDCSDRFVDLSPNSVDALLKLDEDRIITGSENGLISLVGILPNRIIQPIAEHSEYPVERLAFSHNRKFLGSIAHDEMLKLWDLDELLQDSGKTLTSQDAVADGDSDEMDLEISHPKINKGTKRKSESKGTDLNSSGSFFADL